MAGNPHMKSGMPSVNPKGRPVGVFHNFQAIAGQLMDELSTEQIMAVASNPEKLKSFRPMQALVLTQLSNAFLRGEDIVFGSQERERLFDRAMGKPKETIEQTTVNASFVLVGSAVDAIPEKTRDQLRAALEKVVAEQKTIEHEKKKDNQRE